ncbi:MAG: alpha-L-fucosidase [Clostridia bacterium]|nr:alpha-L-fucosidase [Clostridia bacterium]
MNYFGLEAYGAVPSEIQVEWYRREKMAFFHFGINTFTGREWGDGSEDPGIFNPEKLDCRSWMRTIKEAGYTTAIITAKHHDGFCLWPSKYTEHSVKNSPYKNGNGDIVREFTDACREYGIKAGIYLSPWDRNYPDWGTEKYNEYYNNQLVELMTNYGKIYECWWDGAGSDKAVYDWGLWAYTVKKFQPQCAVFGPFTLCNPCYVDTRWVGNEAGFAGDPCYATINPVTNKDRERYYFNHGEKDGSLYMPAEVDVSIRPGWFYHENQDSEVRTPSNLVQLWFDSVGSNCVLLVNIPPDKNGLIAEADGKNLIEAEKIIRQTFAFNLLCGSEISADKARSGCEAGLLTSEGGFYAPEDGNLTPSVEFDLKKPVVFDCVSVSEVIELGHRVRRFKISAYTSEGWTTLCDGECIGNRYARHFAPVTATKIRLEITDAAAVPAIADFGIYKFPFDVFAEETAVENNENLLENPSSSVEIGETEAVIDLGGIYPFNTVTFNGDGMWKYEIFAFDGQNYYKIFEGDRPGKNMICKFETVKDAYRLKIVYGDLRPENLNVKVYNMI